MACPPIGLSLALQTTWESVPESFYSSLLPYFHAVRFVTSRAAFFIASQSVNRKNSAGALSGLSVMDGRRGIVLAKLRCPCETSLLFRKIFAIIEMLLSMKRRWLIPQAKPQESENVP
ncbi:MAG TPA: hypothetical protein VFB76_00225 [Candidatus Angelobacter sp.]|nr:hypothetical protein [Candidatus Angelobacter sp.]